jgi:replicative DNA helicase
VNRERQAPRLLQLRPIAGRVPAHDLDAEAAVLSALMLDQTLLPLVADVLKPESFYADANRLIFAAIVELRSAGKAADIATVASALRDAEQLAKVGGPGYLAQIADASPHVTHIEDHARIVAEKARQRALTAIGHRLAAEGYGDVGDVSEWIAGAEHELRALAQGQASERPRRLSEDLRALPDAIDAAAKRGGISGLSTGFDRFDKIMGGIDPGDVVVVAARPGMGKTAWVTNIAVNVAAPHTVGGYEDPGAGVLLFSLEMPRAQLVGRMVASEARIDLYRIRTGYMQPDDWRRLTDASTFLDALPLFIDDRRARTVNDIRAQIRRVQAEHNRPATPTQPERKLKLVIIDYLQLMRSATISRNMNREERISEITRELKILAGECGVAIVLLSQLNRDVEKRSGKDQRPRLCDLRESGAIEQDADAVVFIHRPEKYSSTAPKGIAEIIVEKHRNGPEGKACLRFHASCTRFDNLPDGEYEDEE